MSLKPRRQACEPCRVRKLKCEPSSQEGVCIRCFKEDLNCSDVFARPKARPSRAYIATLEDRIRYLESRLRHLEDRLRALDPGTDIGDACTGSSDLSRPSTQSTWGGIPEEPINTSTKASEPFESNDGDSMLSSTQESTLWSMNALVEELPDLSNNRYTGIGSMAHLAKALTQLRTSGATGRPSPSAQDPNRITPEMFSPTERAITADQQRFVRNSSLPPRDLLDHLTDLYRHLIHPIFPLLHWPSFIRDLDSPRLTKDPSFRSVVFGVIASAAPYSDDPRVIPDADLAPGTNPEDAKGIQWMIAGLHCAYRPFFPITSLHDLQFTTLFVVYVFIRTSALFAWTALSPAVRRFIDAGAHREKTERWTSSFMTNELRKRAFWLVVTIDGIVSFTLGRPKGIQQHELDVAYPLAVRDYDLERLDRMCQLDPSSVISPSFDVCINMKAFLCYIRLFVISGQAYEMVMGTIRNPERNSKCVDEKNRVVMKIDSAMNEFKASLPAALRWPPRPEHKEWAFHAGLIAALFYDTQMYTHAVFLADCGRISSDAPSLAICLSAASASARLFEDLRHRGFLHLPVPWPKLAATAGLILLLPLLDPSTSSQDSFQYLRDDLTRCIQALEAMKGQHFAAMQFQHGLTALAAFLPNHSASSQVPENPSTHDSPSSSYSPDLALSLQQLGFSSGNPGSGPILFPDGSNGILPGLSAQGSESTGGSRDGSNVNLEEFSPSLPAFESQMHYANDGTQGAEDFSLNPFESPNDTLLFDHESDFLRLWPVIAFGGHDARNV